MCLLTSSLHIFTSSSSFSSLSSSLLLLLPSLSSLASRQSPLSPGLGSEPRSSHGGWGWSWPRTSPQPSHLAASHHPDQHHGRPHRWDLVLVGKNQLLMLSRSSFRDADGGSCKAAGAAAAEKSAFCKSDSMAPTHTLNITAAISISRYQYQYHSSNLKSETWDENIISSSVGNNLLLDDFWEWVHWHFRWSPWSNDLEDKRGWFTYRRGSVEWGTSPLWDQLTDWGDQLTEGIVISNSIPDICYHQNGALNSVKWRSFGLNIKKCSFCCKFSHFGGVNFFIRFY